MEGIDHSHGRALRNVLAPFPLSALYNQAVQLAHLKKGPALRLDKCLRRWDANYPDWINIHYLLRCVWHTVLIHRYSCVQMFLQSTVRMGRYTVGHRWEQSCFIKMKNRGPALLKGRWTMLSLLFVPASVKGKSFPGQPVPLGDWVMALIGKVTLQSIFKASSESWVKNKYKSLRNQNLCLCTLASTWCCFD